MAENDLSTLGFAVDTSGVESGSRRGVSALDALEKKALSVINAVDRLQQRLNQGLNVAGLRSGPGGRQSAVEEVEARHQARMAEITGRGVQQRLNIEARAQSQLQSIHARRESASERHAQLLVEIEARGATQRGQSIGLSRAAGAAALGLATGLTTLGNAAVQSAIDIDDQVNVLKSLTGSAEAAERRYAQLIATAQKTPGLTTRLAATLDAQLRVAGATERAIDRVLPAIGKLNAVTNLRDPQRFAQNLVQLVTQNFERTDLKELVGQSPLAGELIKQIFNVDSPTNSKAIRESAQKLGITTVDAFADAFGKAAENNKKLAGVTESISTQIAKLQDRVTVALRPLGLPVLSATGPLFERAVGVIEQLSAAFDKLPAGGKTAIVIFGALAAILAPLFLLFGKLTLVILAIGAAVANLALIWKTNFFGMRDIAEDAFGFVVSASKRVNGEFEKNQNSLRELTNEFRRFSDEATPIVRTFWETFKVQAQVSLEATLILVKAFVAQTKIALAALTAQIEAVKLAARLADQGREIGPGVLQPGGLATLLSRARGERAIREAETQRRAQQKAGGLDGEEVTAGQMSEAFERQREIAKQERKAKEEAARLKKLTDTGKTSRESDARAIRAAQEQLAKAQAEALLDVQEKQIRNLLEIERDAFDQRLINADQYYRAVEQRELELQDVARRRIEAELTASQARLTQAKPGGAEAIREQAQIIELAKQLQVLELERPNILRRTAAELRKVNEDSRQAYFVKLLADGLEKGQKANAGIEAVRKAQLEQPSQELRQKEIEIQGLRVRGILTEQQATDALILTQRKYRDAIIEAAQAQIQRAERSDDPNRFAEIARLEEEIATLRNLGAELTRTEQLQKRFAEQTTLDLSRVNEGVEDFLASQKGVTEAFSDFRRNQVADVFGLIERGVDKLTEKLGLMGDAIRTLLKDLLKLAATELFKKLFNVGAAGQRQSFAFAGAPAGGGFNFGGFSIGGGSGQSGGGFSFPGLPNAGGPFTPPFNPNAGGIPGLPSGGTQQGGGFNFGNLIRRIPGLGGLFERNAAAERLRNLPITVDGGGDLGKIALPAQRIGLGASLGATGLLAGGGLLGSLLGGRSAVGRLAGGLGGTLALGALGGSGLLGGGIASALPAFFSSPFTAVIGGVLLGVGLLSRLFGDKTLKSLRGLIKGEYGIDVKANKVLENVKALGESKFGKEFKKKQLETIRLAEVKDLLVEYAERTGQKGNSKLISTAALQDPFNEANRFKVERRQTGGILPYPTRGRDYIPAMLDGGEFVINARAVSRIGAAQLEALNTGRGRILSEGQIRMIREALPQLPRNYFPGVRRQLESLVERSTELAPPPSRFNVSRPAQPMGFQGGGLVPPAQRRDGEPQSKEVAQLAVAVRHLVGVNVALTEALRNLQSMPPGEVVVQGLRSRPGAAAEDVAQSFQTRDAASMSIRDNLNRR